MNKTGSAGPDLVMTRVFDAPRELVFRVSTDPHLIPEWWGPRGLTTTVEKMDVKPGGEWRFIQRDQDGGEYAFHGEYREVVPSERLVSTFEYEGMPGQILVDTTTFETVDGKTKLTTRTRFPSAEARDAMNAADMESGARETMDRLEELLRKVQGR